MRLASIVLQCDRIAVNHKPQFDGVGSDFGDRIFTESMEVRSHLLASQLEQEQQRSEQLAQ